MKKKQKNKVITVLGAGIWGSVLANHLAKNGYLLNLWEPSQKLLDKILKTKTHPNIKNFKYDKKIKITGSLTQAVANTNIILIALHSQGIRKITRKIAKKITPETPIVIASKGIEYKTGLTMSEVVRKELDNKFDIMAISGPSFALEVAKNVPTKLVLASRCRKTLQKVKKYFHHYPVSIETTTDIKTVELGGALKNVFAIGCGIINKKFGANTTASFITYATDEMNRIIKALGGKTKTCYGISGLGDFILTASSDKSRNTMLGRKLAGGVKLNKAKKQIQTVTEGANTVKSVMRVITRKKLNAPITKTVYNIIYRGEKVENLLKTIGVENVKRRQRNRS